MACKNPCSISLMTFIFGSSSFLGLLRFWENLWANKPTDRCPWAWETNRAELRRTLFCSTFEARQGVVGHLQNDQRNGRAVVRAIEIIRPMPVFLASSLQFISNCGIPIMPVLAARVPHGLGGIEMAVTVVHLRGRVRLLLAGFITSQKAHALIDGLPFLEAEPMQGSKGRRRACEARGASEGLIAETSVSHVLAAFDIVDGFVHGRFRDIDT